MGLVRDWRRQMVRAIGASLIAPVALLIAALVVVAGGGGLGGVGSLTQIAVGPSLPEIDVATVAQEGSLARADVVALRLSGPGGSAAELSPGGGEAATADAGASPAPDGPDGRAVALIPESRPGEPSPIAPSPDPQIRPASPDVPASAPPPPPPAPPAPPAPTPRPPLTQVIETTRDLSESLPAPLGPTTGEILDFVLGARP